MKNGSIAVVAHFRRLADPRVERTKKHPLLDIVVLAICAVICGAEGWAEIAEFGRQKQAWLKRFLRLPHGIPSHDTIARVFRRLKPQEFQQCFLSWTCALQRELGVKQVAIDGKTLRRSFDRASAKSALHLVSAWTTKNRLVVAQQAVDSKSNEITAIPELLRLLELKGAIVTLDAIGCQKSIVNQVIEAEADYVLAVKDNQPTLHAAVQEHFLYLHENECINRRARHHRSRSQDHGRTVERHYYICSIPKSSAWNALRAAWPGLRSIGQVITWTHRGDGQETSGVRYYISSLPPKVKQFAHAVRSHWGIENSLHWVLDVSFDEDGSRIRKDHGPENFALLRRLATSMIRRDTSPGSIRRKRKRAGWSNPALLNILTA
jgi:predicted transposase YbfD/YdcC